MKTNVKEKALRAQIAKLIAEVNALEDARRARENRSLLGKCFRYRNRYSSGAPWWLYARVVKAGEEMTLLTFQRTDSGVIEIKEEERSTLSEGYEPMSLGAFERAWSRLLTEIARKTDKVREGGKR